MAKLTIKKASTSVPLYVFVQDSSVTTGAGLTGLAYNTASLVASYVRPLAARAAITLATQTVTGAFSSGGFVEVDATNMPGLYRLDVPDAAIATGVNSVIVMLKGAANMVPVVLEIDLVAYDPQDTVRLGLTAMPNVASGSAGAIITSGTGTAQLSVASGLVALADATSDAVIADAVWNAATATYGAAGSYGLLVKTDLDAAISTRAAASALATAQTDLDTITGANGATLATTQPSITFQPIIITAADAVNNITLAGSGTSDGIAFTRSGSGTPFDAVFAAQIQSECADALTAYDPATGAEAAAIKAKTDSLTFTKAGEIDANVQSINGVTIVGDGGATPFNV